MSGGPFEIKILARRLETKTILCMEVSPSFLFSLNRDRKKYRKRNKVRNNFYQTINSFGGTFCNQLLISKTVEIVRNMGDIK